MAANLGLRVPYVYKLLSDSIVNSTGSLVTINTLRPYSAWSIPITRRDPGPDGVLGTADDAGTVTLFDYSPAYRDAAFVNKQIINSPNSDRYHSCRIHDDEAVLVEVDVAGIVFRRQEPPVDRIRVQQPE